MRIRAASRAAYNATWCVTRLVLQRTCYTRWPRPDLSYKVFLSVPVGWTKFRNAGTKGESTPRNRNLRVPSLLETEPSRNGEDPRLVLYSVGSPCTPSEKPLKVMGPFKSDFFRVDYQRDHNFAELRRQFCEIVFFGEPSSLGVSISNKWTYFGLLSSTVAYVHLSAVLGKKCILCINLIRRIRFSRVSSS